MPQLLILLLALVVFWFVAMRPGRNQQRRMQELQRDLEVGQEVVLSSGIFGTVRSLDDEGRVQLEVAPGTELTVARQAVVRRVEPPAAEPVEAIEQPTEEPTQETTQPPAAHDPQDPEQHPEQDQERD
ncbi:MAG: preprotein translocase subunit YajC [Marmoricola sp.]|nr:preprotein translocase subunit YajC [Marmoricola sp.]